MKRFIFTTVLMVILLCSFALAALKQSPQFTLSKFKMKLGTTQSVASVMKGTDIDIEGFESSNPGVVKILSDGTLKAVSTGISTITYKYEDDDGKEQETYTYIEVTVDEATFDTIAGQRNENIILTLNFGEYSYKLESSKGAIPNFPQISKANYVFDGWYKEPEYLTKVTEKERFAKDTSLYGRWITTEEFEKSKIVPSSLYDDITNHWARNAIESVSYMGLFSGVAEKTFGPEITMTRAMAVSVIGRLDKANVEGKASNISDASKGAYYDGYLAWAVENKIVNDVKDNKFRPNDPVTREEMAVYIKNYIDFKGYKYDNKLETSYTDASSISSEAKEAVEVLYNLGIMTGNSDGSFTPKASATRAQMAQIFYNYNNFANKYKG